MTAHALPTPLEQLLFFQSLRALGSDAANFAQISATLQENEFVRANPQFDADRLSPSNLQQLYLRLLKDEVRGGDRHGSASSSKSGEANRRKRKLSTPPLQSLDEAAEHNHLLPQLVDRLYARYQEHVARAIRADEARYDALTKDIAEIERGDWDQRLANGDVANGIERDAKASERVVGVKVEPESMADDQHRPHANLLASDRQTRSPAPPLSTPHRNTSASPAVPSTATKHGTASPSHPSDQQRPAAGTPRPSQGPPANASPHLHATPSSGYNQQAFNYYANQGHPPYAHLGPQGTLHSAYNTPTAGQLAHQQALRSAQQGGFPGAHPGYVVYQSQPAGFPPSQRGGLQTPASTAARRQNLPLINTNVSSTKWKSTGPAQRSPTAPPRSPFLPSSPDLSPTEDTKTPIPPNRRTDDTKDAGTPTRGSTRRGRWAGHSARGRGGRADSQRSIKDFVKESRTRSQSVASHAEDSAAELPQTRRLRGDPSTPHAATEDASAMSTPASSSRPGHRRNTLRGSIDIGRSVLKRKRADTLEGSPDVPALPKQPVRPNHVLATRNFHRIVQPLMQEINSHKLASMFAKPITERDAPGYSSIIYQSQDLKTIRSAISAGSRMIQNAEKEATETAGDDVASPATTPGNPNATKANIWLEKSADVMPPKAIVNSAQLEKEVYRMFANAVMFNLDPQRGLGAAEHRPKGADEEDEEDDDDTEKHYEVDDGGAFVRDAREMFTSVEESVSRWRSVETGGTGSRGRGVDESEAEEPTTEA